MSEAEKKIEEEYPFQALREAVKFGYHLGYEQAMKEHGKVMQYSTPAAAVQNIHVVTMAPESNEPSQDELWEEMFRVDEEEGTQEAKKRYRITRI